MRFGRTPVRPRSQSSSPARGPHTLRHTFASHFLKQVPDLFLLARVLGHSYTRVTRLYSHLLPEHLARACNAVRFALPVQVTATERAASRWKVDPTEVCKPDLVRTVPETAPDDAMRPATPARSPRGASRKQKKPR